MKDFFHKICRFFGSWRNLVLPAAFCITVTVLLSAVVFPAAEGISIAANTPGYQAVSTPRDLIAEKEEVQISEKEPKETVNLDDFGGMPQKGDKYGTVSVEGTTVNCSLYYGDSTSELHSGGGTFLGAQLPGQGGVTLIGAHTGTFFRDLESARIGADIKVETFYGEYHYKISDMQVVEADNFGYAQLDEQPRESLLLYTCYPFGQAELTPYRYMIYSTYVSGPEVIDGEEVQHES